jgi:hypothetical protein
LVSYCGARTRAQCHLVFARKHSKALVFLNCALPECQITRQRFLKWAQAG